MYYHYWLVQGEVAAGGGVAHSVPWHAFPSTTRTPLWLSVFVPSRALTFMFQYRSNNQCSYTVPLQTLQFCRVPVLPQTYPLEFSYQLWICSSVPFSKLIFNNKWLTLSMFLQKLSCFGNFKKLERREKNYSKILVEVEHHLTFILSGVSKSLFLSYIYAYTHPHTSPFFLIKCTLQLPSLQKFVINHGNCLISHDTFYNYQFSSVSHCHHPFSFVLGYLHLDLLIGFMNLLSLMFCLCSVWKINPSEYHCSCIYYPITYLKFSVSCLFFLCVCQFPLKNQPLSYS